jgi:protein disulfide-isomerase A6
VSAEEADRLVISITSKTGVKSNIKPPPPPATRILDAHNFDQVVLVSPRAMRTSQMLKQFAGRDQERHCRIHGTNPVLCRAGVRVSDAWLVIQAPWCGHCKSMKPIFEKGRLTPLTSPPMAVSTITEQSPRPLNLRTTFVLLPTCSRVSHSDMCTYSASWRTSTRTRS